jgi:prevent-host-death family protein
MKLTAKSKKCTLQEKIKGRSFMREISAKEARGKFSSLLKSVEVGGEVVILRRGKQVARLVPPLGVGSRLPSLKEFRASILISGEPLSATVLHGRKEERF